jgi:hypothetical protein
MMQDALETALAAHKAGVWESQAEMYGAIRTLSQPRAS